METKTVRVRGEDQKEFVKTISSLTGKYATWEIWSDFVTMTAICISNAIDKTHFEAREQSYLNIAKKYNDDEIGKFATLIAILVEGLEMDRDRDFLGELYMSLGLGSRWKGQFFTPYSVCKAMAKMNGGDIVSQIEERGFIRVADQCCGAGALLIAFANEAADQTKDSNYNWQNHILFCAQDIDMITGLMCYIQLSLLGCAGFVKIGNSLTDPMTEGEAEAELLNADKNRYWYTPMYFHNVWAMRRVFYGLDRMMGNKKREVKVINENNDKTEIKTKPKEKKTAVATNTAVTAGESESGLIVEESGQIKLF